jgi:hypothetical protein
MGINVLPTGFDKMFESIVHFTGVCYSCHATCLILLPGFFHPHQSSATNAQKTKGESIEKLINAHTDEKNKKGKIFSACHKGIWGNGGTAPCIPKLCTRWRPIYLLGKTPDTHLT